MKVGPGRPFAPGGDRIDWLGGTCRRQTRDPRIGRLVEVSDEIVRTENVPVARNRSVWHAALRADRQAIHLPGVDLPAVVAPENVALAITVEVADVLDVPVVGNRSVRDAAF